VEKLDYLIFGTAFDAAPVETLADDVLALAVFTADTDDDIPAPTLLLGRGPDLRAVVSVWVDSVDDRARIEEALGGASDGYLVTESVPQQRRATDEPQIAHFTWFPKPQRLSYEDFLHGWHDVHTPSTTRLHPTRVGYTRDTVARTLTPGSPSVDAIVFEYFTIADYIDPKRLYGSKEAVDETISHLPLYADYELLNSRPMRERVVKPLS
jgi:hypothetical protein